MIVRSAGGLNVDLEWHLTKYENQKQKQFLLQLVEEHREKFPNANRTTVSGCHPNC